MFKTYLAIAFFLTLWLQGPEAEGRIVVDGDPHFVLALTRNLEVWHQREGDWSRPETVIPAEAQFESSGTKGLNTTAGGVHWIRLEFENTRDVPVTVILRSQRFYFPIIAYREQAGQLLALAQVGPQDGDWGDLASGGLNVPVKLEARESVSVYLKLARKIPKAELSFLVMSPEQAAYTSKRDLLTSGVILGLSILMMCSNFFLYLRLRKSHYLFYCLYVFFYMSTFCFNNFIVNQFSQSIATRSAFFEISLWTEQCTLIFAALFAIAFLRLQDHARKSALVLYAYIGLEILNMLNLFWNPSWTQQWTRYAVLITAPFLLMTGLRLSFQGSRPALFYSIGWGILILGNTIRHMISFGLIPTNYYTEWTVAWSAAAEMVILSFAMSAKVQEEQRRAQNKIESLNRSLMESHEKIEESFDNLQRSEESRTRFFHNTSHELRTPLNGILGYLSLLLRLPQNVLPNSTRDTLVKIQQLSDSLKQQINTILQLAQYKKGEMSLIGSRISLEDLRESFQQLGDGLCLHHKGTYFASSLHIDEGEPSFICDYEKLYTIIRNLVGNAVKFSAKNRENHVHLNMRRSTGMLEIQVIDTGIGIPEAMFDSIFEEFRQLESADRRQYEGTGLGLALVKNLVTSLNGRIKLKSTEGMGSCFTIFVPEFAEVNLHRQELETEMGLEENLSPLPLQEALSAPDLQLAGAKLVVIDDHVANCEILEGILSFHGAHVQCFRDGRKALEVMDHDIPDLVLLDMMMPDFSGQDVLTAMKQNPHLEGVPVIVVTARAGEQDRLQTFQMGADDYLAKPILEREMILRIRNLLSRLRLSRRIAVWQEKEKLTLLGEMLDELCDELQRISGQTDDTTDMLGAFPIVLKNLAPTQSLWVKMSEEGMDFDLDRALSHPEELNFIHASQGKIPALRLLRFYLSAFEISEDKRIELWHEILAWEDARQQAFATTFQILSRSMSLEAQSEDLHRLLSAMLTLCRHDEGDQSCEISQVVNQTVCLLEAKLAAVKITTSIQVETLAWPLSAPVLMQILLRMAHFGIHHATPQQAVEFHFHNSSTPECAELRLRCQGLVMSSSERMNLLSFNEIDLIGEESLMGLSHAKRLAKRHKNQFRIDFEGDMLIFVLRFAYADRQQQTLLAVS